MNTLASLLKQKEILVADGAWTTELQRRGLAPGTVPERWNTDDPSAVRALARAYAAIPVDVITSNTFGANRMRVGDAAAALNERGVGISREAAGRTCLLAAALGPVVDSEKDARRQALEDHLHALQSAGVTTCVFETQIDVGDAVFAVTCARALGITPIVSFTFQRDRPGALRTHCDSDPEHAAAAVLEAGAIASGANCCDGPEMVHEAIRSMAKAHPGAPLWAKPNAGVPARVEETYVYPESPQSMAAWAVHLADAGARIIGGCCGCGADHIAAMAAALRGATRP